MGPISSKWRFCSDEELTATSTTTASSLRLPHSVSTRDGAKRSLFQIVIPDAPVKYHSWDIEVLIYLYELLIIKNFFIQIFWRFDDSEEELRRFGHHVFLASEERGGGRRARHVDPGHGREQAEAA